MKCLYEVRKRHMSKAPKRSQSCQTPLQVLGWLRKYCTRRTRCSNAAPAETDAPGRSRPAGPGRGRHPPPRAPAPRGRVPRPGERARGRRRMLPAEVPRSPFRQLGPAVLLLRVRESCLFNSESCFVAFALSLLQFKTCHIILIN